MDMDTLADDYSLVDGYGLADPYRDHYANSHFHNYSNLHAEQHPNADGYSEYYSYAT